MDLKNPFALYEDRIITIYDLNENYRGLKCNCICPNCKAPFEAKMGDIRQWHFAHSGTPCDSVKLYVNSCYSLVRQILLDNKSFIYPGLTIKSNQVFEIGSIKPNNVDIKLNNEGLAVGLIINEKDLAIRLSLDIEYCVNEIKKPLDDLSTLLVDFKAIQGLNTEELTVRICKEIAGKTWLYSKAAGKYKAQTHSNNHLNSIYFSEEKSMPKIIQKEYHQPTATCILCKKTVHKEDAMWGKNHHGFICHKCIENKHLNWRNL